jgi:hypothetical protein
MMATDRDAFDLFAFLGALNRRDLQAFDKLTEEGQKAAHPLVIMRWLSGTGDQAQIIRLNEFANRYVFSLGTEKPLLFKLLAAACTGKTQRASWIKGPGSVSTKLAIEAIKQQYDCSTREAKGYLPLLSSDDVVRFAEDAGWDKDQLKKLTTELDKDGTGPGSAPKSSRKPKK